MSTLNLHMQIPRFDWQSGISQVCESEMYQRANMDKSDSALVLSWEMSIFLFISVFPFWFQLFVLHHIHSTFSVMKKPHFVFLAFFVKTRDVCVCVYWDLRSASCFLLLKVSSLQASPHSVQSSAEPASAFLSSTHPLHDPGHLCMPQSPVLSGVSEACLQLKISKATA